MIVFVCTPRVLVVYIATDVVFGEQPAARLERAEAAGSRGPTSLFAHVERDAVRLLLCGEQVHVVGDQHAPAARDRRAPRGHPRRRPAVRPPLGLLELCAGQFTRASLIT